MFPTSGDSHCSSHQEVRAFKKTVVFVCCFIIPRSQREQIHKVCACPRATGLERTVGDFWSFPGVGPGFPGANLTGPRQLALGVGWGGAWLLKARPLPSSLGSPTLPKSHTKKQRATAGLVASLGWGTSIRPGRQACGSRARTRALDAPQCGPGLAGIRDSPGTHRGAPEAACSRGCSSPRGGETRWAHCSGGGPQLLDPVSRLYLGLPLRAARREGLRSKIGTLQLFFFFLQLDHEVPTHFFFFLNTHPPTSERFLLRSNFLLKAHSSRCFCFHLPLSDRNLVVRPPPPPRVSAGKSPT